MQAENLRVFRLFRLETRKDVNTARGMILCTRLAVQRFKNSKIQRVPAGVSRVSMNRFMPRTVYIVRGMVLFIAREGIHINRTENQHTCFIARRAFIYYL
jgi:hypothetical protein